MTGKIWFLGLTCLVLSCKREVGFKTPYFPLAVSKSWVYDWQELDVDEGEVDTVESGLVLIEVLARDTLSGYPFYPTLIKFIFSDEGDTLVDTIYFSEKEESILYYDSLGAVAETLLLLPFEKGKSWYLSLPWLWLIREEDFPYQGWAKGRDTVWVKGEKFSDTQRVDYFRDEISGSFWLGKEVGLIKLIDREGELDYYTEISLEWKGRE